MKISSSEYDALIRKFPKLQPTEEVKISTPNTHKSIQESSWKYERFDSKNTLKKAEGIKFTIPGPPVGKPRQTQSDKWKKRPCVMRYRAWADVARKSLIHHPMFRSDTSIFREVHMVAFLELPSSYSKKKKYSLIGTPHFMKPDIDNIAKSLLDALFTEDSKIWKFSGEKRWDDGLGCRIEVELR